MVMVVIVSMTMPVTVAMSVTVTVVVTVVVAVIVIMPMVMPVRTVGMGVLYRIRRDPFALATRGALSLTGACRYLVHGTSLTE